MPLIGWGMWYNLSYCLYCKEIIIKIISLVTYLVGIRVKGSLQWHHVSMIKWKVVLYLTFHFQVRTSDAFSFFWYPPVVIFAVCKNPDIMWTVHPCTMSLRVIWRTYRSNYRQVVTEAAVSPSKDHFVGSFFLCSDTFQFFFFL